MVDVHSHILPFIDDGSENLEDSFKMIEKAIAIGVKDIILTPHALRLNIKTYNKQHLLDSYNTFKELIKQKYDINLYLGQEISFHKNMISALKNKEILSINNSQYILLELPFNNEIADFDELVFSCKVLEYKIIIAHIERYEYLDFKKIVDMKKYGVLFQVNSNSITGRSGKKIQQLAFKLFKHGFVELVGSDVHAFRKNDLDESYQIIKNKFGEKMANDVYLNNPKVLFNI